MAVFDRVGYSNLYVGGTSALPQSHKFDVLVLCAIELQPGTSQFQLALGGARLPRTVLSVPMEDCIPMRAADQALSRGAARLVAKHQKKGQTVLVTCYAGQNRSGLVAALALMTLGMGARPAIERIRAARGPQALSNPSFVNMIQNFGT